MNKQDWLLTEDEADGLDALGLLEDQHAKTLRKVREWSRYPCPHTPEVKEGYGDVTITSAVFRGDCDLCWKELLDR